MHGQARGSAVRRLLRGVRSLNSPFTRCGHIPAPGHSPLVASARPSWLLTTTGQRGWTSPLPGGAPPIFELSQALLVPRRVAQPSPGAVGSHHPAFPGAPAGVGGRTRAGRMSRRTGLWNVHHTCHQVTHPGLALRLCSFLINKETHAPEAPLP